MAFYVIATVPVPLIVLICVAGTSYWWSSLLELIFQWIQRPPILFHDVKSCQRLLFEADLASRAAPNQRLAIAFGIDNGFTTTDEKHHRNSRAIIERQLHAKDTELGRIEIYRIASQEADIYMEEKKLGVPLLNLVQVVVFRIVLFLLFPDLERPSTKDVEYITEKIDSLWDDSKSPVKVYIARHLPSLSKIIRNRQELHSILQEMFAGLPPGAIPPQHIPLNQILPAYVGLWKVVLYTLVETRFRSTSSNRLEYATLFSNFIQTPDNNTWYRANASRISAQILIAESLRLYPPTRRLYTQKDGEAIRAVDIERMHRTGDLWGENPLNFDPLRWPGEGLDVQTTDEYMPFGAKDFKCGGDEKLSSISKCPSRKNGGPRLCAVLVGALFGVIGEDWVIEATGYRDKLPMEGPLNRGRRALQGLRLKKVSASVTLGSA